MVGWWPLGGDCGDYSGYNNGGAVGNINWGTTDGWRTDKWGNRRHFLFDGNNDYILVPNAPQYGVTTNFTLSAWVRYDDMTAVAFYPIIEKRTGGTAQFEFRRGAGTAWTIRTEFEFGGYSTSVGDWWVYGTSDVNITLGTWYHITLVFTTVAEVPKFYVNGVLRTCSKIYGTYGAITVSTTPLWIGGTADVGYTKGVIGDVRFYNRALSAAETKLLYRTPYAMLEPMVSPYKYYSYTAPATVVVPNPETRFFFSLG